MPAAALLPSRNAVGRLQNKGEHTMQPAAATDSMATASIGLWLNKVLSARPVPPTRKGTIMCQRRSRVASEWRHTRTIEITAHTFGTAVSRPISSRDTTPVERMTDGIQNANPDRLDTVQ